MSPLKLETLFDIFLLSLLFFFLIYIYWSFFMSENGNKTNQIHSHKFTTSLLTPITTIKKKLNSFVNLYSLSQITLRIFSLFSIISYIILIFLILLIFFQVFPSINFSTQNQPNFANPGLHLIDKFFIFFLFVNFFAILIFKNFSIKSFFTTFSTLFCIRYLVLFLKLFYSTRTHFSDIFINFGFFGLDHVYSFTEKKMYILKFCAKNHITIADYLIEAIAQNCSSISEITERLVQYNNSNIFTNSDKFIGFISAIPGLLESLNLFYNHWVTYSASLCVFVGSIFIYRWWNSPSRTLVQAVDNNFSEQQIHINTAHDSINEVVKTQKEIIRASMTDHSMLLQCLESIDVFKKICGSLAKAIFILNPTGDLSKDRLIFSLIDPVYTACTGRSLSLKEVREGLRDLSQPQPIHFPGPGYVLGTRENDNNNNNDNSNLQEEDAE